MSDYNDFSERLQIEIVSSDGWAIKYIENPSEDVQLAAVKEDGYAIADIDNPSEEVQLKALENIWTRTFYKNFIKDLPNKLIGFKKNSIG